MNRFSFFLAALFFAAQSQSQPLGFKPMKDSDGFQKKFFETHNLIGSINCQFKQERKIAELKDKIVSSGSLWFKKKNKVRIEYQPPLAHIIVCDGQKFIFQEKGQTRESHSSFQKINNLLMTAVDGSLLKRKDFRIQFFENDSHFLIELVPTKSMKNFFKSIHLYVSPSSYLVDSIIIEEADGDTTTFMMKEVKINPEISDSLFTLK